MALRMPALATRPPKRSPRMMRSLLAFGPGIIVMLADTDAGSVVTAAQSGAQWGFRLLSLQVVLIPILIVVQELTVRLGILTGKGHGELIREYFGAKWAWIAVGTLVVACLGAMVTELSGLVGIGHLYGVPSIVTIGLAVAALLLVVWTGSYFSVERVALGVGAFELTFLAVAWLAEPRLSEIVDGFMKPALTTPGFLYLAAANVGAVVMPWMVFYQQSAVVDKRLTLRDLGAARWDTVLGAVVTQVIMSAILIASAATIGHRGGGADLETIEQIADALIPFVGGGAGKLLFSLAVLGASLIAALVVSLTVAWGLGEVAGYKRSLEHRPQEAPWFYAVYTLGVVAAGAIVATGANLVDLSIAIEVMNALLLPIVLGFLYILARRALPADYRIRGAYAVLVGAGMTATAGFGVVAALIGFLG